MVALCCQCEEQRAGKAFGWECAIAEPVGRAVSQILRMRQPCRIKALDSDTQFGSLNLPTESEQVHLEHAEIKGYRSLRDITIPFAPLTSCIGPNGSGKSSLLGALRLLFNPSATADERDYWSAGGESVEEISIKLTFSDMAEEERTVFEAFLDDEDQLVIERRFERGGSAAYLGNRLAIPEFLTIRMLDRAHRTRFNEIADSGLFDGLEKASSKHGDREILTTRRGPVVERGSVCQDPAAPHMLQPNPKPSPAPNALDSWMTFQSETSATM